MIVGRWYVQHDAVLHWYLPFFSLIHAYIYLIVLDSIKVRSSLRPTGSRCLLFRVKYTDHQQPPSPPPPPPPHHHHRRATFIDIIIIISALSWPPVPQSPPTWTRPGIFIILDDLLVLLWMNRATHWFFLLVSRMAKCPLFVSHSYLLSA